MQMKTNHIKSFIAAFLLILMNSCVEETFEKGAPDRSDCMGVYFVEGQKNQKTHSLEKGKDDTYLDFVVRRIDDSTDELVEFQLDAYYIKTEKLDTSNIEVPVSAKSVFQTDNLIEFKKGQRETTVRIGFDNIKMGTTYNCTLTISDPKYVSIYSNNASSLSFGVEMFEWDYYGTARFRDGLISEMFETESKYLETEVTIEQRRDKERYFRLKEVYSAAYIARLLEGEKAYEESPKTLEEEYSMLVEEDLYIYLDATDSSEVFFPAQKTGFSYPSLGDIYMTSDVAEGSGTSNAHYGTLSDDGVITFPKNGVLFGVMGYFYVGNSAGKARIILPDKNTGKPSGKADFGVDMSVGEVTDKGEVPVTFTLEKDASKVKYCVFKGKLSDIEIDSYVEKVKAAADDQSAYVQENGTYNISFKESDDTGIFTLIACSYDDAGNYKTFNIAHLGYVKPGESREIEILFEASTNDRYASDDEEENFSSRNSFQYWIKGKNITRASVSYYPTSFYNTYKERIHKEMKEYGSLSASALKAMNEQELSGVIGNTLTAGTCYTLVIYAENGYQSRFFADTVQTKGTPDYKDKLFYYDDLEKFTGNKDASAYTSDTWIPVSIDVFDADAEGRTIRGNFRAKTVSIAQKGEQMVVSGLFPALKTNPDITFDYKDGLLYSTENMLAKVVVKDSTHMIPSMRYEYRYLPRVGAVTSSGDFLDVYKDEDLNERNDLMVAGFVDEDIIAFTDNRTKYNFWVLALGGYLKDMMGDTYLHNLIGDGHGNLLLVRNTERGRKLIENLEESESLTQTDGSVSSPVKELSRFNTMPKINNSIFSNLKISEIEPRLVEFSATRAAEKRTPALIRLEEQQIANIMR